MPTTTEYDIHYVYEVGYDDNPKLWAFELYKNEDGYWETISDDIVDRYDFTEEDIAWLLNTQRQQDGSSYEDLPDLFIDEWFNSSDKTLADQIPPNAREWLRNLTPYEYEDLTKKAS